MNYYAGWDVSQRRNCSEVAKHVAEVMEKLVANASNSLPESRSLHKVVVEMSTFLKWWIGVHIRLKQTLIRYAM